MANRLADLLVALGLDSAQYTRGLKKAREDLSSFAQVTAEAAKRIEHLLEFEVVLKGAEKFYEFVHGASEAADRFGKLAQAVGMPAEQLQKLTYAASLAHVAQDQLSTGLTKLSRNMQKADDDGKDATRAFTALGIKTTDATGHLRNAQAVFDEVADRFSRMEDGAGKTNLAMMLFGKSGAELIPLLNKGAGGIRAYGDELERTGRLLSAEVIESAERFNDSLTRMKGGSQAFGAMIAAELAPSLEKLADSMSTANDKAQLFKEGAESIAIALKGIAWGALAVYGTFGVVGKSIGEVAAVATNAVQGNWREVKAILKESDKDIEAFYERVRHMQQALFETGHAAAKDPYDLASKGIGPHKTPAPILPDITNTKSAIRSIREEIARLHEQSITAGMGQTAAQLWSVQYGTLAIKLKEAGKVAEELRPKLVGAIMDLGVAKAEAELQKLGEEGFKHLGKEVEKSALEMMKMEKTTESARLEFELTHGELGKQVAAARAAAKGWEELWLIESQVEKLRENTRRAEGARTIEALRSPAEQYTRRLEQLKQLRDSGAIDQGTFGRGQLEAEGKLQDAHKDLFAGTDAATKLQADRFKQMYQDIDTWRQADVGREKDAARMKSRVDIAQQEARLAHTQQFFGTLATMQNSSVRAFAAIGKTAAVAQATIDGILAVQKALASAPPPFNFAMAAAVGAATAANVAQITGIGFESGGFTGWGGRDRVAGVVHGQEFVTNAAATSRYRPVLEAMNAGGAVGLKAQLNVINEVPHLVQMTQTGDNEFRIRAMVAEMIEDRTPRILERETADPNSRFSKAQSRHTNVERKR